MTNNNCATAVAQRIPNLTFVLRRANAHYALLARCIRSSLQPTNHARRHAARLGLGVDIVKAVHCEQRQISIVPLPILDTDPSPVAPAGPFTPRLTEVALPPVSSSADVFDYDGYFREEEEVDVAPCVAQAPAPAQSECPSTSTGRSKRPLLRCIIPVNVIAPEAEPCSKFSADSEYSAVTLTSSVPSSIGMQGKRCSMVDEGMGSASSEEEAGDGVIIVAPIPRRPLPVEIPRDAERMSWGCGEMTNEMDISSASSVSGSSVSGSSSGLLTPDDDGPLMIRIKRKSASSDFDADDLDEILEKRPKFERKEWVNYSNTQRRNMIRISPLRR